MHLKVISPFEVAIMKYFYAMWLRIKPGRSNLLTPDRYIEVKKNDVYYKK